MFVSGFHWKERKMSKNNKSNNKSNNKNKKKKSII